MVVNRQNRVRLDLTATRGFVRRLRSALNLNGVSFDVSLVDDREIERLNATFRGKRKPTDVLSFPWTEERATTGTTDSGADFPFSNRGFLGDVVISTETARRNAREAGHSVQREISWLILHGALHLLGYDHETDQGEMNSLELSLRERLGVAGANRQ